MDKELFGTRDLENANSHYWFKDEDMRGNLREKGSQNFPKEGNSGIQDIRNNNHQ